MNHATSRYQELIDHLRGAYDGSAAQRDEAPKSDWKLAERAAFLERLRTERKTRLLEVGAGTGHDSLFFQEQGMDVVATDLSSAMVERCRAKGLEAYVMDFLSLDFPAGSFDAVYALNCLLHVPSADVLTVLSAIADVLASGGLFFLGVYGAGGEIPESEGIYANDWHDPRRFFAHRSDDRMRGFVEERFTIVDFHVIEPATFHFQSFTLRV